MSVQFDNSYARLPGHFYAHVQPDYAPAPALLAWNQALADELGIGELEDDASQLAQIFSGNQRLSGSEPIALVYAGHQFGHFNPQLGDGRALLLGEIVRNSDGKRFDIQLKGSGQTPYSRNGDGKAALGPVIREYLVSEAMHRLGVPTSRALAAVTTGEEVMRESILPGGVLTRVASSHLRIGTFEYFSARNDLPALKTLAEHAIARHYPEANESDRPYLTFFQGVLKRQAELVAHWLDIGFIHGVMNTDNMTISGETIDYGPCAFLDEFDYDKVFSSIDRDGRYAYASQPGIALWNLTRLAECLLKLDDNQPAYEDALASFEGIFREHHLRRSRAKLGMFNEEPNDPVLIGQWMKYLQDHQLDYTLSFRKLAQRLEADDEPVFGEFESAWKTRVLQQAMTPLELQTKMNAVNPLFIPRNHQIERAIQAAIGNDFSVFNELREVLANPFEEQPQWADYAKPPKVEERVQRTFCGT